MSANIDMSNNRTNFASLAGVSVWWGLGQVMQEGRSLDEWIDASGTGFVCEKVPSYVPIGNGTFVKVENAFHIRRTDTGSILSPSTVTGTYQLHQSRALVHVFQKIVDVDPRLKMETMGSLAGGAKIWALAKYQDAHTVGGAQHVRRLLLTTSFDASMATIGQGTETCVVCQNTLMGALADSSARVTVRHNTGFNPKTVFEQLQRVTQASDKFKEIGDAMAQVEMARDDVSKYFKELLGIPFDAAAKDVSTRKMNQFADLSRSYRHANENESADCPNTVWTALNAVTRYVDHDRSTRGGDSEAEARVLSSQFGSGAAMKAQAMGLLMPRIKDRVPVLAS